MWLNITNKVHNTKMQLQKQQTVCTELYSCGTEEESRIKLMLDDQSIDKDWTLVSLLLMICNKSCSIAYHQCILILH